MKEKLSPKSKKDIDKKKEQKIKGGKRFLYATPFISMILLVSSVYTFFSLLAGKTFLIGLDFKRLFLFRIDYLKESIAGGNGIPGWYSREFLGTPFWSNIQNFPLIPTRFVFYVMDTAHAYAIVVLISALLSAVFTYLYTRKCGLNPVASAASGWTFACSGFFASRIWVGHLSLIESFFSLPLLLWLTESFFSHKQGEKQSSIFFVAIVLSTFLISLSGHPQIPFYAIVTTVLYVLWKERSSRSYILLAGMASGILSSLVLWYPFIRLVLRSTRVLNLNPPENNIFFPYGRLKAFLLPWADGWTGLPSRGATDTFTKYPNNGFFWDTICYCGVMPLIMILLVALFYFFKKRMPGKKSLFFGLISIISIITAFPFTKIFYDKIPLTLFRSPSRQIYIVSFCIALGFGFSINYFLEIFGEKKIKKWAFALILIMLALHFYDLRKHDRYFVGVALHGRGLPCAELKSYLKDTVKDGRVAIDYPLFLEENRKYDDVGFFDSIVLASTYKSVLEMIGKDPSENLEELFSSTLKVDVLKKLCARVVVSSLERKDLPFVATIEEKFNVYEVPDSDPRVSFVSKERQDNQNSRVHYKRISGDKIEIEVDEKTDGFLKIVESYDTGWTSYIDGLKTPIEKLDGFMMKVNVPEGNHKVILEYKTPGAVEGAVMSVFGIVLFISILVYGRKKKII